MDPGSFCVLGRVISGAQTPAGVQAATSLLLTSASPEPTRSLFSRFQDVSGSSLSLQSTDPCESQEPVWRSPFEAPAAQNTFGVVIVRLVAAEREGRTCRKKTGKLQSGKMCQSTKNVKSKSVWTFSPSPAPSSLSPLETLIHSRHLLPTAPSRSVKRIRARRHSAGHEY